MHYFLLLLVLLYPSHPFSAEAELAYAAGDHIDPITLKDQHDVTVSVNEDTRVVLFTTDMPGGKVVSRAIGEEKADFLPDNRTVFLSNISGMPGMVTKMIALPRMRKHPYSIALDRDGETTKRIPTREGNTTILIMDRLEIKSIVFTKEPADVKKAIITGEQSFPVLKTE